MKHSIFNRALAAALAFVMLLALVPVTALAQSVTYVLDVSSDVPGFAAGTKEDGETEKFGTDGYFTIFFSKKMKVDSSNKNFEDGVSASMRLNFQGETQFTGDGNILAAIQLKTSGPAKVKVWWVCGGNNRTVNVFDSNGATVAKSEGESVKNSLYITELSVDAAGTYYLGNMGGGGNYFFRVEVTEESAGTGGPTQLPWNQVAEPVIASAEDDGKGNLKVTVDAPVGAQGGEEVVVYMYNAKGEILADRSSILEKDQHILTFNPDASGDYTFKAELLRQGETPKKSRKDLTVGFVLPLVNPIMISATSKGDGKVELDWTSVKEAESYEILADGKVIATATEDICTITGLKVGQKYIFQVNAVRGEERKISGELSVTVTQEEKATWGFTHYGSSTNADNNGFVGSLNEDGHVTVYSENGKGKIVPKSTDGVAFYYTRVPVAYNFTLRAKVTVDSWTYSNGQEGFGLMVADRLGTSGDSSAFWNNSYMAVATKMEYRYDSDNEEVVTDGGIKYTMKLGLGIVGKTGATKENLSLLEKGDTNTIANMTNTGYFTDTLEWGAGYSGAEGGREYNIIGNRANTDNLEGLPQDVKNHMITEMILEIDKNNTGYFISYYSLDGQLLCQKKLYGADAMNQLDEDYVYAGFFASRNARATFSDVYFSTRLASEDAPPEERPITKIEPTVTVSSGNASTKADYTVIVNANVGGNMKLLVNGKTIVENIYIQADERHTQVVQLDRFGENNVRVEFTPDPDQELPPYTELASIRDVIVNHAVMYNLGNYHRKVIYVSPEGLPNNAGTVEYPYDIYTAVNNAVPGQTILLMEGTYELDASLKIQRGVDGTEDAYIRMIADPNAKTRPVLDFQGLVAGIVHGGNYWYFAGFDVTNSAPTQKGFQVSGNHNVLDQIHTYRNGNTGIQISRLSGTDTSIEYWPSHNLILNCTSYLNADPGEQDADGFAAKLTCGVGNVFDGCVAYNNADDGWDLYAKVESGMIGAVTIRNCVAYNNGIREDGSESTGNGNGFKMGGESLSGKHVLENSIAFNNKEKGIDSNSCPDIIVKNCVSYNNGSHNVALYTNNASDTDFHAEGIISFKDASNRFTGGLEKEDKLGGRGTQAVDAYMGTTNFYWYGQKSNNTGGKTIGADIFVSLEFKGILRKADGSIDMQGFLQLNSKAPGGASDVIETTPSQDMTTLPEDLECNYGEEWFHEEEGVSQYHWHQCECGSKSDMAEHTFQWIIDREVEGDKTGLKHEECTVCHYKKPAITVYPETEKPDPSEPAQTQPADPGDQVQKPQAQPLSTGVIIAIVAVLVLALAGGAVYVILSAKKKNEEN